MSNIEKIKSIKDDIAALSRIIVEKQYETAEEKHELQKKRWLLKRMLSAIENGEDCSYLDLFNV